MIFTTKAEYGVRLLIRLGMHGNGGPVSLKAVAETENLPLAYLERIAALLKRQGLVEATRGAHGGYVLAKPAEEITMDAGGPRARGRRRADGLLLRRPRRPRALFARGRRGHHCATKLLWTRVQIGVIKSLQRTTLAELVAFSERPPAETTTPVAPATA
jgi:DNA-binding IscR family transcriptional regulator